MIETTHNSPYALFDAWFKAAEHSETDDPNAMSLATVDEEGKPSSRMVLLKKHDSDGFVFYTNFNSRKGKNILTNPHVALLFHWKTLQRQIRIEGHAAKVSHQEADSYFASRDRLSQIGAWASAQSQPLENRAILEQKVADFTEKYQNIAVPRPSHWSGFRVMPFRVEFWQDGAYRLHERLVFQRKSQESTDWQVTRLYP